MFLVFSSPAIFNMYARWYQPEPLKFQGGEHYTFGIVAGGFGSVDVDGDGYFNSSADRFLQTVRLYKVGVIDKILISGGNSRERDDDFREAEWARRQMMQFGVPEQVIFIEDGSKNTRDNARNSKILLDSLQARGPCLLITSAFHMPRAAKLYERAGLDVTPFPCNYMEGRGPVIASDLIPSLTTLFSWPRYIKQTVGLVVGK